MAGEGSYFSRFFVKFVEIIAAGLATAVSGYLVAHLGGLLTSPVPATPAAQVNLSTGDTSGNLLAQPAPPSVAPRQEADVPAAEPTRKAVNTTKASPPRQHSEPDSSAAERKPRGEDSLEAQVRAALANMGSNRPAPLDVPPAHADVPSGPVTLRPEPRPIEVPPSVAVRSAVPPAADLQPQPMLQAPAPPVPPTVVEMNPQPLAPVGALPAAQSAPPAQDDKDVFSALKQIPDLLRRGPPAPTGDAPRPPLPVGQ